MTPRVFSQTYSGPRPPIDIECGAILAHIPPFPPLSLESIPNIRQPPPGFEPASDHDLERNGAFSIERHHAKGSDVSAVPLLLCRPTATNGPRPAIVYIHGGGMISGDGRQGLPQILDVAEKLSLIVVSVEYRLAPETPHPGPVEDCYAAWEWIRGNATDLGITAGSLIIIGESAGGGLAGALVLLARDRGASQPLGLMLWAPMLDDRNDSRSAIQMMGVDTWDRSRNEIGWTALLGSSRGGSEVSQYAAPARATDLSRLPPVFLDVGSAETFRDEVVDFACRLWHAGGRAELHVWPGGFHGYHVIAPDAAISRETRTARLNWIQRVLVD